MNQCGFVVFHITDSVVVTGAHCDKSQNSDWPVHGRTASVPPAKVRSGIGCDSYEQNGMCGEGQDNSLLGYLVIKINMDFGTGDLKNRNFCVVVCLTPFKSREMIWYLFPLNYNLKLYLLHTNKYKVNVTMHNHTHILSCLQCVLSIYLAMYSCTQKSKNINLKLKPSNY